MTTQKPKAEQINFADLQVSKVRIKDFLAGPMRDFSLYDCYRSIPSMVDGFKPSQRKSICGTVKKQSANGNTDIKVAQLAASIAETMSYHHGEVSLQGTVVGLAQNFTGSNNINFLEPIGQFGSRLSPGAGAARYIFTKLSPSFRKMFPKEDDIILNYLDEDGQQIEPLHYYPLLPVVLINGSQGMGTGFASKILGYNPEDLKVYILNKLQNKKQNIKLTPWYKGFKGSVERMEGTGQVIFTGIIDSVNTTTLRITELPIGIYLSDYREFLNKLEDNQIIKDYQDDSTEENFDFTVTVPRTTGYMNQEELIKTFKLVSKDTENFTLWTETGKIKDYKTAENICDAFTDFRVTIYNKRRTALICEYENDLIWLNEKLRFINYYIENSVKFSKKTKTELIELLTTEKFTQIDKLLDIKIYNLTKDQIEKLENEIIEVSKLKSTLENTTGTQMYIDELKLLKL